MAPGQQIVNQRDDMGPLSLGGFHCGLPAWHAPCGVGEHDDIARPKVNRRAVGHRGRLTEGGNAPGRHHGSRQQAFEGRGLVAQPFIEATSGRPHMPHNTKVVRGSSLIESPWTKP